MTAGGNLYYSVNPTRKALSKKAAKTDIAAVEYALADLDPNEGETSDAAKARYMAQLNGTFKPAPTAIVNSGNGAQCLWRLSEPIILGEPIKGADGKFAFSPEDLAKVTDVEARVKAMMVRLGSKAGTQNIDRILRLPGTTNLPNAKKRKDGRVACPTKLIALGDASYRLDAFPKPETSEEGSADGNNIDTDALPVSNRIKNLIRGIDDPEHAYASRSERAMAVLVAMAGASCTDEQIKAVFLDRSCPIAAHILDQGKPSEYLARQIAKARKAATDPHMARLNERYALVLVGDKAAVMQTPADGSIKFLTLTAFEQWFENKFVQAETADGVKKVPLAKHWRRHPQRRQYEGIVFAPKRDVPSHYNLWKGFAVEPRPGECSKFLAHLMDNVCCGNDSLYSWVVGWFAQIAQHPEQKVGTSLVLRGKQGTGKTKVGQVFGSLFGEHYALVSDPRYVTGRFNSHLVSCLLLHCDECSGPAIMRPRASSRT